MILDAKRRRQLRQSIMDAPALLPPVDPHAHLSQSLPEVPRLVYRLVDVEGLTEQEASQITAMRRSGVKKALARAREMLKARLA